MDEKTTKRNLLMFPLGTVGRDMVYALVTNYLLTFVLFTHKLTAGQLAAITGIMIAARVFDALNDPIMGNIIEHTHSKYGKFKPWLLIGVLSTSVVIYLLFNIRLQGWSFVIFFGVMYFLYSITYTMNDISYWGMVPALSSDANERNQFTSRATLCSGIGGTLASILIPLLTTGALALGGNAEFAYGRVALIIALLTPAFLCFTLFGARERRDAAPEKQDKFSFAEVFKVIARNDQLVWVSAIFLIQQVANGIVLGGIGSTYIYFTFGYEGGLYSLFTMIGMSATAFLMIFYPAISRKINRKPLMKLMMIISATGYAVNFLAGMIPGSGMPKFAGVVIGYMLSNFGQYCFYLIMMISIINTVEYNEYKFGTRDEAIITSLRPFITKMGSALVVAFTSVAYIIFGVTGVTNQISTLEQQCNQKVITEVQKSEAIAELLKGVGNGQSIALLVSMTVIPCVLMFISYILYKKKYILDEDEYNRICKEINEKEN